MIRTLLFLVFLVLLAGVTPVSAQTPAQPTPIPTVVLVPGDVTNADISISQTQQVIFGVTQSLGFPFAGFVRLAGNVFNIPSLEAYGTFLENAYTQLSPKKVQEATVNFTNPQYVSGASRLCVYDPQTGSLKETRVSSGVYRTGAVPAINPLLQFGSFYQSILGRGKRADQNYQQPTVEINPTTIVPCDAQSSGQPQAHTSVGVAGQNTFEGASSVFFQIPIVADIIRRLGLSRDNPRGNLAVSAVVKTQQKTPYAEEFGCAIAGCKTDDFSGTSIPDETQARLTQTGGFVESFKPGSLVYGTEPHGETANTFAQTVSGGGNQQVTTRFLLTHKTADALEYLKCTVTPLALQPASCRRDWRSPAAKTSEWAQVPGATDPPCAAGAIEDTTPVPDGAFKTALRSVAAEQNVPECVLAGIAHIEGGWRYTQKSVSACKPANNCSATGPMQFTTGPKPGIDCTKCGAAYCPNAWEMYGAAGNPCNYKDSITAAARLIKAESGVDGSSYLGQEAAIENAGYQYYGSKKGVCRLADKNGRLRSYGQFLVDYCKNYTP